MNNYVCLINTSRFIGFFSAPFSPSKYTAEKGGNVWSLSRVWKGNVNVKLINDKSFISVELDRNYYLDLVAWPIYLFNGSFSPILSC
jgi:hypothetical protein